MLFIVSALQPQYHGQTVVVENPLTVDESGKLVNSCDLFLEIPLLLLRCWTQYLVFMFYPCDDVGKQCCGWSYDRQKMMQQASALLRCNIIFVADMSIVVSFLELEMVITVSWKNCCHCGSVFIQEKLQHFLNYLEMRPTYDDYCEEFVEDVVCSV